MTLVNNPVFGTGFRVETPRWYALDGMGTVKADGGSNQDSAKFKSATVCNVSSIVLTVSVAIFDRTAFAVPAVYLNHFVSKSAGAFLLHKILIPTGTSFEIEETYLDAYNLRAANATEQPVIAIWVNEAAQSKESPELGVYADVILRR